MNAYFLFLIWLVRCCRRPNHSSGRLPHNHEWIFYLSLSLPLLSLIFCSLIHIVCDHHYEIRTGSCVSHYRPSTVIDKLFFSHFFQTSFTIPFVSLGHTHKWENRFFSRRRGLSVGVGVLEARPSVYYIIEDVRRYIFYVIFMLLSSVKWTKSSRLYAWLYISPDRFVCASAMDTYNSGFKHDSTLHNNNILLCFRTSKLDMADAYSVKKVRL